MSAPGGEKLRVVFMGSGEIALPVLNWLLTAPGVSLEAVICQPDKPAGRKNILTPPPTKDPAVAAGIPVWQPERLKGSDAVAALQQLAPDVLVVMAYGQILPRAVRQAGRLACINLHASLLPRWRGASPIQAVIAAGEAESGITVMHVAAGLDTGDIILEEKLTLAPDETGQSLHDRLAALAPAALTKALPLLAAGTAPRTPQDTTRSTHCGKLDRSHGRLDWSRPAIELERQIRAFDPWPGTSLTLPDGKTLKVFPPAAAEPGTDAPPGTVLESGKAGLLISTATGALRITEVQPEGRRRMTVAEFLAGNALLPGQVCC